MTQWQTILASIGIGIFVAIIWATIDFLAFRIFGWEQTANIHITTAGAAATGAWLVQHWT